MAYVAFIQRIFLLLLSIPSCMENTVCVSLPEGGFLLFDISSLSENSMRQN